jgi:hypothetical protein
LSSFQYFASQVPLGGALSPPTARPAMVVDHLNAAGTRAEYPGGKLEGIKGVASKRVLQDLVQDFRYDPSSVIATRPCTARHDFVSVSRSSATLCARPLSSLQLASLRWRLREIRHSLVFSISKRRSFVGWGAWWWRRANGGRFCYAVVAGKHCLGPFL